MRTITIIALFILIAQSKVFGQSSLETLTQDGYDKISDGKYSEALQIFNRGIIKYPNCYDCFFGRAKAKFFLKNYSSALIDCQKSLKDTEYLPNNYSLLGNIKYKLNDYEGAIKAYEKALSIQRTIDKKRNDGVEMIIDMDYYKISQIKYAAFKNNRPQLGSFVLNLAFFDKALSQKLTIEDFYRHIFDYVSSSENQELEEYNEETGKHDLYVNSSEFELNYKGSQIYITLKSLKGDKNPIYYIKVGFKCQCDWFNIKNESALNGYKQVDYSDRPDDYTSSFGGLEIRYRKGEKSILFNKFHSRLYFGFSIEQELPKAKKQTE